MTGILDFILITASAILAHLVSSRLSGKTEFVRKSDVEQLVEQAVLAHQIERDHMILPGSAVQTVMTEIEGLAVRLSYLRVLPDQIEVLPLEETLSGHTLTGLAEDRMKELREAISRRRNELGISEPEDHAPPSVSPPGGPSGRWVPVIRPAPVSAAVERLSALRDRIAQRRES
jgi:hypothetical protein